MKLKEVDKWMNGYSMTECVDVTNEGTKDVVNWLSAIQDSEIVNVENVECFRKEDVDLLYFKIKGKMKEFYKVEIKVDRNGNTGNYFFETISNTSKNTEGCFLYSKCDMLFYYFINKKELHILAMNETREWFLENIKRFRTAHGSTSLDNGDFYKSKGKLVPIKTLEKEVGIMKVDLN